MCVQLLVQGCAEKNSKGRPSPFSAHTARHLPANQQKVYTEGLSQECVPGTPVRLIYTMYKLLTLAVSP